MAGLAWEILSWSVARKLVLGSFTFLIACVTLGALPARHAEKPRGQANSEFARILFDSANRERSAQGLPHLRWDDALALAARRHAQRMVESDTLSHQFPGEEPPAVRSKLAGALFSKSAENIGFAPSAEIIHSQWMHSPHHRANILDRELDSVGIAVVVRDGVLFAAQDFSRAVAPLAYTEQEQRIGSLLSASGVQLLNKIPSEVEVARKQCTLDSGTPPVAKRRSVTVFRFTTTDLGQLPANVRQTIQGNGQRSAAVGACAPDSRTPFIYYRMAIVLY